MPLRARPRHGRNSLAVVRRTSGAAVKVEKVPEPHYGCGLTAAVSMLLFCHASSLANSCDTLTGTYVCGKYCPSEGIGGHDQVVQQGDELQLTDGKGEFKGYISGSKTLIVARIWKENPL